MSDADNDDDTTSIGTEASFSSCAEPAPAMLPLFLDLSMVRGGRVPTGRAVVALTAVCPGWVPRRTG